MNQPPLYTVKGVKSFIGRQGHGFNASLYKDGKKIAFVIDNANGGMLDFQWEKGCQAEEKLLEDYCATLPKWTSASIGMDDGDTTEHATDPEFFMAGLVGEYIDKQGLARQLKKKVIMISDEGRVLNSKNPASPEVLAAFVKNYPTATILNTLPIDEAYRLYRDATAAPAPAAPSAPKSPKP